MSTDSASMALPSRRSALAILLSALASDAAHAQLWPVKPLRLVVGYAAGGATDVIARVVGQKLGEALGQTVVVENRAGANSNLGAEAVARADEVRAWLKDHPQRRELLHYIGHE